MGLTEKGERILANTPQSNWLREAKRRRRWWWLRRLILPIQIKYYRLKRKLKNKNQ